MLFAILAKESLIYILATIKLLVRVKKDSFDLMECSLKKSIKNPPWINSVAHFKKKECKKFVKKLRKYR